MVDILINISTVLFLLISVAFKTFLALFLLLFWFAIFILTSYVLSKMMKVDIFQLIEDKSKSIKEKLSSFRNSLWLFITFVLFLLFLSDAFYYFPKMVGGSGIEKICEIKFEKGEKIKYGDECTEEYYKMITKKDRELEKRNILEQHNLIKDE